MIFIQLLEYSKSLIFYNLPPSILFIWVVNGRFRVTRSTTTKGIKRLKAHNNDIVNKNLSEVEK